MRKKLEALLIYFIALIIIFTTSIMLFLNVDKAYAAEQHNGLKGEYYKSTGGGVFDFKTLISEGVDSSINFSDLESILSQRTGISDSCAVRWTGRIVPEYSEEYTFYMVGDNGFKLWVNDKLIIDHWVDDWDKPQTSEKIVLQKGKEYNLKIEFFDNVGGSNLKLEWESKSQSRQIVPEKNLLLPDGFEQSKVVSGGFVNESGMSVELTLNKAIEAIPEDALSHFSINASGINWPLASVSLKKGDEKTIIITFPFSIYSRAIVTAAYDGKTSLSFIDGEGLPEIPLYALQNKSIYNKNLDFSWVKGAVFVPSNAVNQIQQWEEFDPIVNDRELGYAEYAGINAVRVYLHYLVWENDKVKFLKDIETFLKLAEKHNIKVEFIFFDDCWDPYPHLGPQSAPVEGVHNSRWVQCPGNNIKENYADYKDKLKGYVQDVVNAHKDDDRIFFWEPYNEPGNSQKGIYLEVTNEILKDSRLWIQETGSKIPISSCWIGEPYSDFYNFHLYDDYSNAQGPSSLCTESMRRTEQSVPGIVSYFKRNNTGFIIWEAMIGRDNCRFPWGSKQGASEPKVPFHAVIYPDGHPWSLNDLEALRGSLDGLTGLRADYYSDKAFKTLKKKSYVPIIDFNLDDEKGTGSPDAAAGIGKDNFSIMYSGKITPKYTQEYTFYLSSDNIARLYINGKKIADKTADKKEEAKGSIELDKNEKYDIKIEYIHATGNSSFHVKWESKNQDKEVIPTSAFTPRNLDDAILPEPVELSGNLSNKYGRIIYVITSALIIIISGGVLYFLRAKNDKKI